MSKERVEIPKALAGKVLFLSDRTCCVCRERGRSVQIHHIDENPANSGEDNLAVLCLQCHRDTQIYGGFDRILDRYQIVQYRDDWLARVLSRREQPDATTKSEALQRATAPSRSGEAVSRSRLPGESGPARDAQLFAYLRALPEARGVAYKVAQLGWDTGVTQAMVEATDSLIRSLQAMLARLAAFYPPEHFGEAGPISLIETTTKALGHWYFLQFQPDGIGKSGTIVRVRVGGRIVAELEMFVEEMVGSLTFMHDDFNFQGWREAWRQSA